MTGVIKTLDDEYIVVVADRDDSKHNYNLTDIKFVVRYDTRQLAHEAQKVKLPGKANIG